MDLSWPVKVIFFIVLLLFCVTFLFPFYFMIVNSLKTNTEYFRSAVSLPHGELQWSNYVNMFKNFHIQLYMKNTFLITVPSIVLPLLCSVLCAYAFAWLPFRGRKTLYMVMVATMIIPGQVTLIPLYMLVSKMGLINTLWSVIVVHFGTGIPGMTMLLTSAARAIPSGLFEACDIDGAGYFQRVRHILFPMMMPTILLLVTFEFISNWNELLLPLLFLQKMELRTIIPALSALVQRQGTNPTYQMTGMLICTVPVVIVFAIFQRRIFTGIFAGALK